MNTFAKQTQRISKTSLSYCSYLIDRCLCLKSPSLARVVHAHLIKLGFNGHTFLGNRCLDLYTKVGTFNDASKVFDEIGCKNIISWNVWLKGVLDLGGLELARCVFAEMPERDVVSWNSMVSGYASSGCIGLALGTFSEMQNLGVRPSGYTYSILTSIVSGARHGKEIHGSMIRSGLSGSNVVLGNGLIDMYARFGLLEYAFGVFSTMGELDVISWNSLIVGCCKSGAGELALNQFALMRSSGYPADEFTCSAVITCCSDLRKLDKGKQIFAFCLKVGFLSNTIISSGAIDLFSKCNRLDDSVRVFEETDQWDSALCNAMISSYAWHGLGENGLQLFVLTLREGIRPSEFTFSSALNCVSCLPVDQGSQIHCLVVKLGFEWDDILGSSLVYMYTKCGFIDHAMTIFNKMVMRELISWNTVIMALAQNGRVSEALVVFKELLMRGPPPDRHTLAWVLLACSYGGSVDAGIRIFRSMEESFGVTPGNEHYACVVQLLCQAGRLDEAIDVAESMHIEATSLIWESILRACAVKGDLKLTETVAEKLMYVKPQSSLPYLVLRGEYETAGRWEGLVRISKDMETVKKVKGCSWIGMKNRVYTFNSEQLQHNGGEDVYWMLRLLNWEIEDEGLTVL